MPFTDSINIVDVVIADRTLLNATPSDVAQGKQFIGSTQHVESGTVPVNNPTKSLTLPAGSSFKVPYGINPSDYTITAQSLQDATNDTNATNDDILSGKTAYVAGQKITGSMPNIGTENDTLLCGDTHTISRGYHNGNGIIKAADLMSQTKASIVAADIKKGSDCWANGKHITGTMPNNKDANINLQAGNSYTIPEGYHSGKSKVTAATLESQTYGNAIAETIVEGYTAWVNGKQVTGTIKEVEPEEIILPTNGKYYIPNGYHTGQGYVTQNVPNMEGQTVAPAKEAQVIKCGGYYMNSNITVSGVDALNYKFTNAVVKDSSNKDISNYKLTVSNNSAKVKVYVDNWHDNATLNVYDITFANLLDSAGNGIELHTLLMVNWKDQATKTYTYGKVSISTSLESGTNAHIITISGINAATISMTEVFSAREFGVKKD